MVTFEICSSIGQWSRFSEFYLEHRNGIIPGYQVKHALTDIKNVMRKGRAAILVNGKNEVIGIGGFTLGMEENGFENKEIAVLINSYFKEEYRGNRTFIRGLQVLAEQIKDASSEAVEVRLPTFAHNGYTNRLYGKFAGRIETKNTPYGEFHIYSASFEAFSQFCSRFK
ncbi:hypothetical protein [Cohnella thailandensis]|uniref:N-acetyltransferase domain-containing protein n=1 Tax=Cohnella thailandensis TaxID=557557 RepID=A0A841SV20_9BACL|nr:hypothetical protein [Cohnella thailandensis]MBB6634839.1 hypothetical protein [Cohnella thailandensis]MBP1975940.1 hypothetical protein [Cohnella thailandensis]